MRILRAGVRKFLGLGFSQPDFRLSWVIRSTVLTRNLLPGRPLRAQLGYLRGLHELLGDTVDTIEKHYAPFVEELRERARRIMENGEG